MTKPTAKIRFDALPVRCEVQERFQSYNVEMIEVIGGRFWKPYKRLACVVVTFTPYPPRWFESS